VLKDPISKEFCEFWAKGMVDGYNFFEHTPEEKVLELEKKTGSIFLSKISKEEARDIEIKVGQVFLQYLKGINPYQIQKQKSYSDGAISTCLAVYELLNRVASKTSVEIPGVGRKSISRWAKHEDTQSRNWEKIEEGKNLKIIYFEKRGLSNLHFKVKASKHGEVNQIEIFEKIGDRAHTRQD
jgi:hypothetical protein